MMTITLNGQPHDIGAETTISVLLKQLELDWQQVVVEMNRQIIARQDFTTTFLKTGDTLEVVHFVGGG